MKTSNENITAYGALLANWRKKRRFSQLSFGLFADVSSRHVSFLETGRSRPSREMVLRLADCLTMPKLEINRALLLAGYSPAYISRSSDDVDLEPIHQAITHLIENHMPYPAIGMDYLWNIKSANGAAIKLLGKAGFAGSINLLDAITTQTPEQSSLINWEETVGLFLARVQAELLGAGENHELQAKADKLEQHFARFSTGLEIDRSQAVIPTRMQIGEQAVSIFSTIASFGSVQDIVLDDLKVELMFPLDDASKAYFVEA